MMHVVQQNVVPVVNESTDRAKAIIMVCGRPRSFMFLVVAFAPLRGSPDQTMLLRSAMAEFDADATSGVRCA